MKKNLFTSALLLLFVLFVGCGLGIESPDKRIKATLELKKDNPTQADLTDAALKIGDRFAYFGVPINSIEITPEDQIKIELETFADANRVQKFLSTSGKLEFCLLRPNEQMHPFILMAEEKLNTLDSLGENPLTSKIEMTSIAALGMFTVDKTEVDKIDAYFNNETVKNLMPSELKNTKFIWGRENPITGRVPLYALQLNEIGEVPLTGSVVEMARMSYDVREMPSIDMKMNQEGSKIWEEITEKAYMQNTQIAIVVDDVVYSAPGVLAGPIVGGRSQISGEFTEEEAQVLAGVIEAGAIPPINLVEFTSEPLQ